MLAQKKKSQQKVKQKCSKILCWKVTWLGASDNTGTTLIYLFMIAINNMFSRRIVTSLPKASDISLVFVDAIPVTIVAFAVEISLCQIFATKHAYEIDSNQVKCI